MKKKEIFSLDARIANLLAKEKEETFRSKTSIVEFALKDYFKRIGRWNDDRNK